MTDTLNRLALWQVMAPILDESVLQSLRDMDDPDAERDHHDAERIADYLDTVMDLADWLVPVEEPCPNKAIEAMLRDERQRLRALLTDEAYRSKLCD